MAVRCTLLVLTYNQERFAAAAVNAALAQTYTPLDIFVSDDASTDRTFEIIKPLVERYDGPHQVRLNRNAENVGVVAHTNFAVAETQGDVIIPAYGDDISYPDRVARIAEAFERDGTWLVHSQAGPIEVEGKPTGAGYGKALFFRTTDPAQVATSLSHYLGASGAWARALFDRYGPLPSPLVYDDHILGFRAALEGGVRLIDAPLLAYREGIGLSHSTRVQPTRMQSREQRRKLLRQARARYGARLADAQTFGVPPADPIARTLSNALHMADCRLAYYEDRMIAAMLRHPRVGTRAVMSEALRDMRKR